MAKKKASKSAEKSALSSWWEARSKILATVAAPAKKTKAKKVKVRKVKAKKTKAKKASKKKIHIETGPRPPPPGPKPF